MYSSPLREPEMFVNPLITTSEAYGMQPRESELVRGLRRGLAGSVAAGAVDFDALNAEGSNDPNWIAMHERASQLRQRAADQFSPAVGRLEDVRGFNDFGNYAAGTFGEALASFAPTGAAALAGGLVGGPIGGTLAALRPAYVQEKGGIAGQMYDDPTLSKLGHGERDAAATKYALGAAALESLVPGAVGGAFLRRGTKSLFGKAAENAITEAATETAQEIASSRVLQQLDPSRPDLTPMEVANAAAAGAIGGGGFSAASSVPGHAIGRLADAANRVGDIELPDDLASRFDSVAAKGRGFVDDITARAKQAREDYKQYGKEDDVFGDTTEDTDIEILSRPRLSGSLQGATPEETMDNIDRDESGRVEAARRRAEEILKDPKTPKFVRDMVEGFEGDYSRPDRQAALHSYSLGKKKVEQIGKAFEGLKSKLGDMLRDYDAPKQNLQDIPSTELRQLTELVSVELGSTSAHKAPTIARQMVGLATRLGDGKAELTPAVEQHLRSLVSTLGDDAINEVSRIVGSPALRKVTDKLKRIPSAVADVQASKGKSFFETMLKDTGATYGERRQAAEIIDKLSLQRDDGFDSFSPQIKNALISTFGSAERADSVLAYYGEMRREAFKDRLGEDYDPETNTAALGATTEAGATEEDSYEGEGSTKRPRDHAEAQRAAATAAGYEIGETTERDGRNFSYAFRGAEKKIPFRTFGRKDGEGLTEGRRALKAMKQDYSRAEMVPYSEYLDEQDVTPEVGVSKMLTSLDSRIADAQKRGRTEVANDLRGEKAQLEAAVKDMGPRRALNLYEVARVGERSVDPEHEITDDDLRAMGNKVILSKGADGKVEGRKSKYPGSEIVFKKKDGKELVLSAVAMVARMAEKRAATGRVVSPSKETNLENLKSAIAAIMARPDIAEMVTKLSTVKQTLPRAPSSSLMTRNEKAIEVVKAAKKAFPEDADKRSAERRRLDDKLKLGVQKRMEALKELTDSLADTEKGVPARRNKIAAILSSLTEIFDGDRRSLAAEEDPDDTAESEVKARTSRRSSVTEKDLNDIAESEMPVIDNLVADAALEAQTLKDEADEFKANAQEVKTKAAWAAWRAAQAKATFAKLAHDDFRAMKREAESMFFERRRELAESERSGSVERGQENAKNITRSDADARSGFSEIRDDQKGAHVSDVAMTEQVNADIARRVADKRGTSESPEVRAIVAKTLEAKKAGASPAQLAKLKAELDAQLEKESGATKTAEKKKHVEKVQAPPPKPNTKVDATDVAVASDPELLTVLDNVGMVKDGKWSAEASRERIYNALDEMPRDKLSRLVEVLRAAYKEARANAAKATGADQKGFAQQAGRLRYIAEAAKVVLDRHPGMTKTKRETTKKESAARRENAQKEKLANEAAAARKIKEAKQEKEAVAHLNGLRKKLKHLTDMLDQSNTDEARGRLQAKVDAAKNRITEFVRVAREFSPIINAQVVAEFEAKNKAKKAEELRKKGNRVSVIGRRGEPIFGRVVSTFEVEGREFATVKVKATALDADGLNDYDGFIVVDVKEGWAIPGAPASDGKKARAGIRELYKKHGAKKMADRITERAKIDRRHSQQETYQDGTVKTDTASERAIRAQIRRMLGKNTKVRFSIFGAGKGSGNYIFDETNQRHIIDIAKNAHDPAGVGWHEALHAFFRSLESNQTLRNVRRDMIAAASTPYVMAQLRKLLKDHPGAIGQIETDPEERAAYVFQLWAGGALELRDAQRNVFQKIWDFIREIIGVSTIDERIEELFNKLQDGQFSDMSIAGEVLRDFQNKTLTNKMEEMAPGLVDISRKLFSKVGPDRLRAYQIKSLDAIAEAFSSEEGKLGFIQRRFQESGKWMNRLSDIFEGTTATERRRAVDNLQKMLPPSTPLEHKIAKLLEDAHKYMKASGVKRLVPDSNGKMTWQDIGYVNGYFPRNWDADSIRNHITEWKALLKKNGVADKAIDTTTKAILSGNGRLELAEAEGHLGFTPFASSVMERQFKFITPANAADFAKFQQKDAMDILSGYIHQMVHRAEYASSFGNAGEDIAKAIKLAKLTKEEEVDVKNVIRGLEGTLDGGKMSVQTKKLMSTIMTGQNFILLPLALFSQMIDPIMIAARTGNLADAGRAYMMAVKGIDQTYHKKLARMMGIISAESTLEAMGMTYGNSYMSAGARKANNALFRWNGMQYWNDTMRIAATAAGESYLLDHEDYTAGNKKVEATLKELGLELGDIVRMKGNRLAVTPEQFAEDGGYKVPTATDIERAKRVQAAMFRFVDQAVLRPSASQRPTWMSDPRFMLLAHLKQFTFAMHNVILKRMVAESDKGNNRPTAIMMLTIPVMLASDLLKMATFTGFPQGWTTVDYIKHAVMRSGLLGVYDFGANVITDTERGKMPGEGLLGPSVEHAMKILRWLFGDQRVSFGDVIDRTIPGARLID